MRKTALLLSSALVAVAGLAFAGTATAQERTVVIKGFGAKSGVVRSFGVNAEAAMKAAAEAINSQGGIKLGDGVMGKLDVDFLDDRCTAEEGISVVRRMAAGPTLVAIGPTCSNVAEPLFGVLQKKAGDSSDSGLQFPIFTDAAIKGGLAKISEWAFRNTPSEAQMYDTLFAWVKQTKPELKTIFAGVEENFAHSRASWYAVMKEAAPKAGLEIKGEAKWLLEDTNFAQQVREIKAANPDILAIAAHPFTTCGVLKEMRRQGVKVKYLIGLTSSSSMETLQGCAKEAEGIVIPTSFAPVNAAAERASAQTAKFNGSLDLHSAGMYENVYILKKVLEDQGVLAKPDTIQADRERIRKGLAALKEVDGLMGKIKRTDDRESIKPYMYVHAKDGKWAVLHNPLTN